MSRVALFQSTVARRDGETWWLMNRQHDGWDSTGIPFRDLASIVKRFHVEIGDPGRDEFGEYVSVLVAA